MSVSLSSFFAYADDKARKVQTAALSFAISSSR